MRIRHLTYIIFLTAASMASCKKSAFLDAKPDISISVPTSIKDCQALMDNDNVMNGYGAGGYPSLGETGSDDYYVNNAFYSQYTPTDKNAVIWAPDTYTEVEVNDWDLPYRTILYSNVAIDALESLPAASKELQTWKNAYGSAFFFRGFAYFQLAQIFAKPYDNNTAGADLGLPIRKGKDVNETFERSSVQETYNQLIGDLSTAIPLLPDTSSSATRPSKAAAYGMLARVYLSARNYTTALLYADSCLRIKYTLMDYNTVVPTGPLPFTRDDSTNSEMIFGAAMYLTGPCATGRSFVDSELLASYQASDLRKTLFFKGGRFFGMYDQNGYAFCGIATDEIYLTRAECYARTGNIAAAMNDLDSLMIKRMSTGTFTPYSAADADDALQQILRERRKELLYRGLRWTDLRRLNKDASTATTLTRTVGGTIYTLPPNDPRYIYYIPAKVIQLNPKMQMQQNPTR